MKNWGSDSLNNLPNATKFINDDQDKLSNLRGLVQNENVSPLFRK